MNVGGVWAGTVNTFAKLVIVMMVHVKFLLRESIRQMLLHTIYFNDNACNFKVI